MSDLELENEVQALEKVIENQDEGDIKDNTYDDLALKHGWNPDGKKSSKEYIEYAVANFSTKIAALDTQNKVIVDKDRKVAELEVVLNQLTSDMEKQKQLAYDQAVNDLKNQRKEAIKNGDVDLVERIDDAQVKIEENKQEQQQSYDQLKQNAYNDVLIANFRKNNANWIDGNSEDELDMQVYARQLENAMSAKGIGLEEQLSKLENAVKKKYSDYFAEVSKYSAVEGGGSNETTVSKSKKEFTFNDLNAEQKTAAKYLADKKVTTIETYIKRLVEQGDLK